MKIKLSLAVMVKLLAYAAATPDEFSGFGFCNRDGGDIFMYDFVLLNKGSFTYTEIPPEKILPLLEREDRGNMKCWLHRHPLGSGVPGPHNWSGTDEMTILKEPLGSTPEAVNWSVSIVLTPGGFVGRIDNYVKGITQHLEVEPNCTAEYQEMRELAARHPFPAAEVSSAGNPVEEEDYDFREKDEGWPEEEDECAGWSEDIRAGDDYGAICKALWALCREYDPVDSSLADICADYGIDWSAERNRRNRERQQSLWK